MLTKMKIALALCGSLVAGGVGIAAAHGGADGGGRAAMLQKYDTNKDGKLDDSERAVLKADMKVKREAMHQKMLAKYDTNKDGKLEPNERAVMREERAEAAFKKLDTDGNGQISLDEFKAAPRFGKHHGHHRGFGGKGMQRGPAGGGQP